MNKKVIALMPMKAHSSRVKGKNFKNLSGKPLYRWMLDTLQSIEAIDQIVINTDADILFSEPDLKNEKITLRRRPKELCGDDVSMNLILDNDIKNMDADIYLMTHTTNPLLSAETIGKALDYFIENQSTHDSLFSVNRFQTRFYTKDAAPINHDPDNLIPTQDLAPWYEENSCLYIFTKDSFSQTNARIGKTPLMFEIPKIESIDIDEPEDWNMAEAISHYMLNKRDLK